MLDPKKLPESFSSSTILLNKGLPKSKVAQRSSSSVTLPLNRSPNFFRHFHTQFDSRRSSEAPYNRKQRSTPDSMDTVAVSCSTGLKYRLADPFLLRIPRGLAYLSLRALRPCRLSEDKAARPHRNTGGPMYSDPPACAGRCKTSH